MASSLPPSPLPQYRMHREIAAFSNAEFYGGRLHTAVTPGPPPRPLTRPLSFVHVLGVESLGASKQNVAEAEAIGRLLERLLAPGPEGGGMQAGNIGVISAYSAQVARLRRLAVAQQAGKELEISTLDSFQGAPPPPPPHSPFDRPRRLPMA